MIRAVNDMEKEIRRRSDIKDNNYFVKTVMKRIETISDLDSSHEKECTKEYYNKYGTYAGIEEYLSSRIANCKSNNTFRNSDECTLTEDE